MAKNFLQLNESKLEVLLFGTSSLSAPVQSKLGCLSFNIKESARNLGVTFDSNLSFNNQVARVIQSCFLQLRTISKMKSFLTAADLEKVIHAFISSRFGYCNSLYSGLSHKSIAHLQHTQNAAARLLANSRKSDQISPVLASLHWFPESFDLRI